MNLDRRLLRQALHSRLALLLTIGLGLCGGILAVFQAALLARLIDRVFLGGMSLPEARPLLLTLLGVILGRAGMTWGGELSAHAIARQVKSRLRLALFSHLADLGPAYTTGERTGDLAHTAVESVEALDAFYSQYLPQLVLAALTPLIFLAFVFPLDPVSGLVLLVTAPLIPLFMILIGSQAAALTLRQWGLLHRMSAYFLDVIQGLATLKMLGRSRLQIRTIAQVSDRFRQVTMGVLRVTFLSALALELLSTLSTAVVAVEVGLRLLYGRLAFEQALFVLVLAPEFYLPLRLLGTRFHAGMAGAAAAKRIFEVLETPAPAASPEAEFFLSSAPEVVFDQMSFSYAGSATRLDDEHPPSLALDEISFRLPPGETTALIGPSGAGKSSLASLLLRFVEPLSGNIQVNGVALSTLDVDAWRRNVAWLPQHPALFQGTILENIRLARADASLEQVRQAARQAAADDFITAMPEGYDTLVGEAGARLSGGQAQRIALARAFLKDAPLIILDEPTAHLDLQTEAELQRATQKLLAGRTALVIAHRLSTIALARQVLVLQDGRLVQSGSPEDLMGQDGLYRRMIDSRRTLAFEARGAESTTEGEEFFSGETRPIQGDVLPEIASGQPETICSSPDQAGACSRPVLLSPLLRLLRLLSPYSGLVALSVLFGFATIGSSIGLMATSAYLLSAAALHPSIAELQVAIVGVRFFGIARGLFRYLERYVSHQVTFHLLGRLRVTFYAALEPLAPARLMGARSGDLLARILGDIESLEGFYVRAVAPPLAAVLIGLAASAYLGSFQPVFGLALVGMLLLGGAGLPLVLRLLGQGPGRRWVQARSTLNARVVDGVRGLADLLVYGGRKYYVEMLAEADRSLVAVQDQQAALNAFQAAAGSLLANLALWVLLALAIPLVRLGELEPVFLAGIVLAALASFEAVQPLPLAAQHLESNLEAARRLYQVVDTCPEVTEPAESLPLSEDRPPEVSVRRLSFRYPSTPTASYALKDVSFDLPAGKRLAIVGPSGAGKSTLVHLFLRFWEIQEGEILLNGQALGRYASETIRSRMAVVAQNTYLFHASLRENLLIARPEASEVELRRAIEQAHLSDFVAALPQGLDTWVGERGLRLSGGERQRLAIARALLRDAPILILDEAIAHLDSFSEEAVQSALDGLMQGRSSLTITHRLDRLEHMDEILVLDCGRVVERGAHRDLLAAGGLYWRMWELERSSEPG